MKRYLWTAVAVLFMNANASENPFTLKENLLKIDNDQEMLLSELSSLAEAREDAELDVEIEETKEEVSNEISVKKEDSEEEYNLANAIDELVGNTQEEVPPPADNTVEEKAKADQERVQAEAELKAKAVQDKMDEERAEREKAQQEADKKAKLAEDAREEERREVAAYEKQRAEKLAKKVQAEAEEKAKKIEKKPTANVIEIDVEAEKRVAKQSADTGYLDAVKEMGGEEKAVTEKLKTENAEIVEDAPIEKTEVPEGEIDVESEKRAAAEAAEAAYLEAVREMDQED